MESTRVNTTQGAGGRADLADPGLAHIADLLRYGTAAMPGSKIISNVSDGEIAWLTVQTPHGELQVRVSRPALERESDLEMADRMRREAERNPFSSEYRRASVTVDADEMFVWAMADAFEPAMGLDDVGDIPHGSSLTLAGIEDPND